MDKPKNLCPTHGHELRWGNEGGRGCIGQRGIKGRTKWDDCTNKINKIYLKIMKYDLFNVLLDLFG